MNPELIDELLADWKIEKPELDGTGMQVVGRLLQLGKALEKRMDTVLKDSGIRYSELDVLATLRRSGKPFELTPGELMQSVLITSGAMTALLTRLEKKELIYRSVDENDSRIKRAGLTKKGLKLIEGAIKLRFDDALENVSGLSEYEQLRLADLLKKLAKTLPDS